jgi:hypothetical protein
MSRRAWVITRVIRDTRSDAEFCPAPRNRHLVVLAPCLARV